MSLDYYRENSNIFSVNNVELLLELFYIELKSCEHQYCLACEYNSPSQRYHTCFYLTGEDFFKFHEQALINLKSKYPLSPNEEEWLRQCSIEMNSRST